VEDILKSLAVVLLLLVPGFVARFVWLRFAGPSDPSEDGSEFQVTMETVAFGVACAIFGFLPISKRFPTGLGTLIGFFGDPVGTLKNYLGHWPGRFMLFLSIFCLLIPFLIGVVGGWIQRLFKWLKDRDIGTPEDQRVRRVWYERLIFWIAANVFCRPEYDGSLSRLFPKRGDKKKSAIVEVLQTGHDPIVGYYGDNSYFRIRKDCEEIFFETQMLQKTVPVEGAGEFVTWLPDPLSSGFWVKESKVDRFRFL
jgi:hypothetical protein